MRTKRWGCPGLLPLWALLCLTSCGGTTQAELAERLDRLHIPSGFVQIDESFRGNCRGANLMKPCPSMNRDYKITGMSLDEARRRFFAPLRASGLSPNRQGDGPNSYTVLDGDYVLEIGFADKDDPGQDFRAMYLVIGRNPGA